MKTFGENETMRPFPRSRIRAAASHIADRPSSSALTKARASGSVNARPVAASSSEGAKEGKWWEQSIQLRNPKSRSNHSGR